MNTSATGIALIKRFEGFSATPYLCPAGKWTIGYGHVIASSDGSEFITPAQAEIFLAQDLLQSEQAIHRLVDVALSQHQFDALVSLIYNIGIGHFEKSTLLRLLNKGEYSLAAMQFSRWIFIKGCKSNGLIKRRAAEKALFEA